MKRVQVNGVVYVARTLRSEDVRPGTIIRGIDNRRVYRIVCEDEGDMIVRNLRHPDIVEVIETNYLMGNCWVLVPEG